MTPQLQTQIDSAREWRDTLHAETMRRKQALEIAEQREAMACDQLGQLLEEAKRQNSEEAPHLTAGEGNAYPNGRAAAI